MPGIRGDQLLTDAGLRRKRGTEIHPGSFAGFNHEEAGQRQDRMELNSFFIVVMHRKWYN